jgi:diguanylate cyclase (GGDEF)-like protein
VGDPRLSDNGQSGNRRIGRPQAAGELKELDAIHARFRLMFILTNVLTILLATYVFSQVLLTRHWETLLSDRFRITSLCVLFGGAVLLSVVQWLCLRQTAVISRHKIENLMFTDELTCVFNYRYLERRLEEELKVAQELGVPLTVVYMDLDNFKKVNDECGHQFGNVVLTEFGRFLRQGSRSSDLIGRMGGDEFIIVLPNTAREPAMLVSERIRKRVEAHVFELESRRVDCIRVSMGVATFPDDAQDKELLITRADQAMYRAKQSGGNRVST